MNWLEIPAHRVLEVESKELEEEFDMYDDDGKLCGGAAYISCSVGKTARDSSSLDSVTSTALSNEIALTLRRFRGQSVQGMITVRDVHSLVMIIFPHQAPRVFIVPQIRRTLIAVDAHQAPTPRTRSERPSRGLSHTQFFIFSHMGVRCLSGRLATRANSGL